MNNPINLDKQEIRKTSDNNKTFKIGIVIDDNLVWCLNDFKFYTIPIEPHHGFFEETENDRKREVLKEHIHEYIEFTSSISTSQTEISKSSTCVDQTENIIENFWFKKNKISEVVSFYFSEYDIQGVIKEMEGIVDNLDIESVISNYMTHYKYESRKLNSDTWGEDVDVYRSSYYADAYIDTILPPCVFYHKEAKLRPTVVSPNVERNDYQQLYVDLRLERQSPRISEFYVKPYETRPPHQIAEDAKKEDEMIRERARKLYSREVHITNLVNDRLMMITLKKIEIEAKYHIQEAINLIKKYPRYKLTLSKRPLNDV